MELYFKCIICAILIMATLPGGLSLKCWDCRSDLDPKCADPFDNTTFPLTECNLIKGHSGESAVCRKIIYQGNGEILYTRDCAFGSGINSYEGYNIIYQFIACDLSGCNA